MIDTNLNSPIFDCNCTNGNEPCPPTTFSTSTSPSSSITSTRHHFRQFCHCNCSCIHKCHHEQQQIRDFTDNRPASPRMSDAASSSDTPSPLLPPLRRGSLASVVAEMENGTLSLSNDSLNSSSSLSSIGALGKRRPQLSNFIIERDLGEGAYAFVKQVKPRRDTYPQMTTTSSTTVNNYPSQSLVMKMIIKSKLLPECILHDFETGLSLPVELYALRHLRDHPHPNIVSMVDAFEDPLYYYLLMPMHGKGEDLFEVIERHVEFLPVSRVERIFSQVAMAIAHLHLKLGLVHRDIKDENIIIDDHDRIQLIDFGSCAYYSNWISDSLIDWNQKPGPEHEFASPLKRERIKIPLTEADVRCGQRQSRYHTFYGTIDYAPPEIVRGEPYDGPPQDIWALGILLYTLAFKEVPFRNISDILEGRLRLPFEPSLEIVSWIKRLLSLDPKQRPTAIDLVNDTWIKENYAQAMDPSL